MKLVTAIIKLFKLEEVREALSTLGVTGLTVTDVNVAYTSKIGDGKIFVTSLDHVIRIRTGEIDNAAL